MPVPNDLTPEEEREFSQHGVAPQAPAPTQSEEAAPLAAPAPAAEPAAPHGDRPATEQPRDPATGQFVTPPAAAPEGQPQPGAESQPAAPPPGFVPHQALHQERSERQRLQQQMAILQARTNAMLASQQPQQSPPLPSLEEDPVGYVRGLEQRLQAFEQERTQEAQYRQIDSALQNDEASFRSYTPDYDVASDYYVQSRAQELLNFYPPQQAQQIMLNEARQMAQEAWQRGIPAAQMVYQMAQARGYRPGTAPATPQMPSSAPMQPQAGQQPQMGQMPSNGLPAQPNPTPAAAAVVAAAQQGQQAVRTLSGGSGSAAQTNLNAEALLSMSDEEFEQYLKLGQRGANERFAAI